MAKVMPRRIGGRKKKKWKSLILGGASFSILAIITLLANLTNILSFYGCQPKIKTKEPDSPSSSDVSSLTPPPNESIHVAGDRNVIGNNNVVNDIVITSISEVLSQAQIFYDEGQYSKAAKLYLTDFLQNNAIAQCNLGYLYANCLPGAPDIATADHYYKKAYGNGCEVALSNMLTLHIRCYDDFDIIEAIIRQGIKDENINIIQYVIQVTSDNQPEANDADSCKIYCQELLSMPLDKRNFFEWRYCGIGTYTYAPENTATERFRLINYDHGFDITGDSWIGGRYEIYKLLFKEAKLPEEKYIRI